ncbi:hypothetical protein [Rhodovulum strictum]|uniref:4-amino-4-deoxy-L-arabinose transferase n=1 Tax=Rhodovulum strictum TaxID=58314 RepID=A0A844B888_9RHOB|nr:hypothetical protein [Rhodovulum strictum]MRH20624.1 hypothetical protein [Rhodovulum strictum]
MQSPAPDAAAFRPVPWLAALTLATAALIVLPLVLNPFLPFEDLPNHIARRHLAAGTDGALADYFILRDGLLDGPATNAAVDLAWRLRMLVAPVSAADAVAFSHWAMGFAMVGFMGAVMVLHRVLHGRWSAWPLLAGLLVHNANILWGFENYAVTLPFGILGLALWIATRGAAPALRLALTLAVVALLYLGHVLVLLAYAALVIGYEAGRAWRPGLRPDLRAVDWPGLVAICTICLAHVLIGVTAPAPGYGSATQFGPLSERLQLLLSPFGSTPGGGALLHPLAGQAVLFLAALPLLWALARRNGLSIRLAAGMRLPLLLLGLVTLLMPVQLSGVHFTHLRYPVLLLGLLIAATDLRPIPGARPPSNRLAGGLMLALLAVIALRAHVLDRAARAYSAEIASIAAVAANLPAGARVLPVIASRAPLTTRHFHSAAYLVPLAGAFVPTLFVGGSHRLALAPEWQALSAAQPVAVPLHLLDLPPDRFSAPMREIWAFVPGWQDHFTHVLLIGGTAPDRPGLDPLASAAGTTLLALRPVPGDPAP